VSRGLLRWGVLPALVLPACTSRAEDARTLRLLQVRPQDTSGVFLNEPLVFHFSEPLDPTSVTGRSVQIVARGEPSRVARGRLRVSGRTLVFEPDPVLAFELDDGGYLPDTTYDVQLAGFPRPDGLRGRSGAPLAETATWEYHTVAVSEPRAGFVFEDHTPDGGLPLVLRTATVAPGDPIVFEGGEPLDPSTLFAADFVLRKTLREQRGEGARAPMKAGGPPIPIRARLTDNRDRYQHGEPGQTTRVELQPLQRLEAGEEYRLQVEPTYLRLRDFGGNRVLLVNSSGGRKFAIDVVAFESSAGTYLEYTETFIDDVMRSVEHVPETDGTVFWGSSGRAEVRWPAAAGSGEHGEVELGQRTLDWDVQSTRMSLARGQTCLLSTVPGLVVLRAQGSLRISGQLKRMTGAEEPKTKLFREGETLSEWLVRARAADHDCTVLIAGGDLVVDGWIDVEGPLLLVAGGRLRVSKNTSVRAAYAAAMGEGAPFLYSRLSSGNNQTVDPGLVLDLATENRLQIPLTFGVRSTPIPREGAAARWHPAPRLGSYSGAGTVRVRYLGEQPRPDGTLQELGVDDPAALDDSPTLRLELRLEVLPGEVWDPPWVDSVQVRWDPEGN
jgi:hypothetical protein